MVALTRPVSTNVGCNLPTICSCLLMNEYILLKILQYQVNRMRCTRCRVQYSVFLFSLDMFFLRVFCIINDSLDNILLEMRGRNIWTEMILNILQWWDHSAELVFTQITITRIINSKYNLRRIISVYSLS